MSQIMYLTNLASDIHERLLLFAEDDQRARSPNRATAQADCARLWTGLRMRKPYFANWPDDILRNRRRTVTDQNADLQPPSQPRALAYAQPLAPRLFRSPGKAYPRRLRRTAEELGHYRAAWFRAMAATADTQLFDIENVAPGVFFAVPARRRWSTPTPRSLLMRTTCWWSIRTPSPPPPPR